jgi:hypothetical protein
MAGIITRGAFSKALWEGIQSWYGEAYAEWPVEWTKLFQTYSSKKAFEEDVSLSGFGLFAVKPEGEAITYDSMTQGFVTRYTHVEYGLGFIITNLMVADDLYMVVGEKKAKALAFSARQSMEVLAHNVYNRAFNSTYTGGDGKELCATDHPNVAGGTWQNELTTASDLNELAVEQALIDIGNWTNDRGLQISVMPQTLHIPIEEQFNARRLFDSVLRPGTAENDTNVLNGIFPGGVHVHHYFSDTDAWFIRTNCPDSMKHYAREPLEFYEDNDTDTKNLKYLATFRASWGHSDPRGVYASPGN